MSSAASVIIIINNQIASLNATKARIASDLVTQQQIDDTATAMAPVSASVQSASAAAGV